VRIDEVTYQQAKVSVLRPDGAALWTVWPRAGQDVWIDTLVLPVAGTHRITADPEGPVTGGLRLRLSTASA
jgi:hypothetical protein